MANQGAFIKVGNTSKIAADTTAPSGVQLAGDTKAPDIQAEREYRVQNNGGETVFYAYGASAAAAQSAAVIPTNASVGAGSYPLSAGAIEVIRAPIGQFWSGITTVGAVSLFITPGKGL